MSFDVTSESAKCADNSTSSGSVVTLADFSGSGSQLNMSALARAMVLYGTPETLVHSGLDQVWVALRNSNSPVTSKSRRISL